MRKIELDEKLNIPFSQKPDRGISKNYRDIILIAINAKVYNALLLNPIQPEVKIS